MTAMQDVYMAAWSYIKLQRHKVICGCSFAYEFDGIKNKRILGLKTKLMDLLWFYFLNPRLFPQLFCLNRRPLIIGNALCYMTMWGHRWPNRNPLCSVARDPGSWDRIPGRPDYIFWCIITIPRFIKLTHINLTRRDKTEYCSNRC